MFKDDANSFLLHVEVINDDSNEEVEREEGTEHDEEHKVQVHEVSSIFLWLLTNLYSTAKLSST